MSNEAISINTDIVAEAVEETTKAYSTLNSSIVRTYVSIIKKSKVIKELSSYDFLRNLDDKIEEQVNKSKKLKETINNIIPAAKKLDSVSKFGMATPAANPLTQSIGLTNPQEIVDNDEILVLGEETVKSQLDSVNESITELEKELEALNDTSSTVRVGSAYSQIGTVASVTYKDTNKEKKQELESKLSILKYNRKQLEDKYDILRIEKCMDNSDFLELTKNILTAGDIKGTDAAMGSAVTLVASNEQFFEGGESLKEWYMNNQKYLTEDQQKVITYLYNTYNSEECTKYMNRLEDQINKIKALEETEAFIEKLESNPDQADEYINNFLSTFAEGTSDGVITFFEGLKNLINESGTFSVNEYKQMFIMEALSRNEKWNKGLLFQNLSRTYNLGTSLGNMAPSIIIGTGITAATGGAGAPAAFANLGRVAGAFSLGASVVGNSYHSAKMQGADTDAAWAYGIVNGLSEAGLEYALGAIPGLGEESKSFLVSIAKEGGEEFTQEILQGLEENAILGKEINIDELLKQSEEAALCGALMGGLFNASKGVSNAGKVFFKGKELVLNNEIRSQLKEKVKSKDYKGGIELLNSIEKTKADTEAKFNELFGNLTYNPTASLENLMKQNSNTKQDSNFNLNKTLPSILNTSSIMANFTNNLTQSNKTTSAVNKLQYNLQLFAENNKKSGEAKSIQKQTVNKDESNVINSNNLYDASLFPLSSDETIRNIEEKFLRGEKLSIAEVLKFGRDKAKTEIDGFKFKSDHAYRATTYDAVLDYMNKGYIKDDGAGKGYNDVSWYLGGTSIRYGKVIIETAADTNNFDVYWNNENMSGHPYVKHIHSSNTNPISFNNVERIIFLDKEGQKVLKVVDASKTSNLKNEIELGHLLYEQDMLLAEKIKRGGELPSEKQTKLDEINKKIESYNDSLNKTSIESLSDDDYTIFYHGGVTEDFNVENLDVTRLSEKQQKAGRTYAGFYMYSDTDRACAFNYARQENSIKNTTDKGVIKLRLSKDLNIYEVPPFSITRITQEKIKELQDQGYDLIKGKMLGKYEYILINKEKIANTTFMDMSYENMIDKIEVSEAPAQVQNKDLTPRRLKYNLQTFASQMTIDEFFSSSAFEPKSVFDRNLGYIYDINRKVEFAKMKLDELKSDYSAFLAYDTTVYDAVAYTAKKYHSTDLIQEIEMAIDNGNYNVIPNDEHHRDKVKVFMLKKQQYLKRIEEATADFERLQSEANTMKVELNETVSKKVSNGWDILQKLNERFQLLNDNKGHFGTDQGIFRRTNRKIINEVTNRVMRSQKPIYHSAKAIIKDRYNMDNRTASSILNGLDNKGACSYAATVNEIIASYLDNESAFERDFGFPLYRMENGIKRTNGELLLADLFVYMNHTENGGSLLTRNAFGQTIITNIGDSGSKDFFNRVILNAEEQQYMSSSRGKAVDIIDKYLKSKNPNLSYSSDMIYQKSYEGDLTKAQMNDIKAIALGRIYDGKQLCLGIYTGKNAINMINLTNPGNNTSTQIWKEDGGHEIFITGIDNEGFHVSSWGNEFLIRFEDLQKGRFSLYSSKIKEVRI